MDNFEEALRNIDVFCRTLVRKMIEYDDGDGSGIPVVPVEELLLKKNIVDKNAEPSQLAKTLIPLSQAEEPLVDVFEDNTNVTVLMQVRCKDHRVTVHTDVDGIEICKRECHKEPDGKEVCVDKCQKLDLNPKHLQLENMVSKCNNNSVYEVEIPKTDSS